MNGRNAKMLRSMAQLTSVGIPEKKYGHVPVRDPKTGEFTKSPSRTIALDDCTRKRYQTLKKRFKEGRFGSVKRQPDSQGDQQAV